VLVDKQSGKLILSEAEFNLDVALRCRDLLRARGAEVVLTREDADTFTAPWPVDANGDGMVGGYKDDLQERVDILNNSQAEVFVSIHANGGRPSAGARQDIQVQYCGTQDCAFPSESKRLGRLVVEELDARLASVGYPVSQGELITDLAADSSSPPKHIFMLGPTNLPDHVRATAMPGVLSETLYVTSGEQAAQLKRDDVRQAIALAYADALESYLLGTEPGGVRSAECGMRSADCGLRIADP
jgi:N-acetylmuramoyl-L-alanine amidase